jgi:hypothetical protein
LIPCCGLEVQNPQVLKSDKGPGNTFDLNPKWTRTLPSLIYFSCDIYRDAPPQFVFLNIRFDIDGKVLAHLGFKSKVFPGPLTDISLWVGICTSSPQQGVKYQI